MNVASSKDTNAPRLWLPRQHGAWAMLAIPLLLGVSVSSFTPWQLLLAGAAATGYLSSVTAERWRRARSRRDRYLLSLLVYGSALAVLGLALVVSHPALLLALVVIGPAELIVLALSRRSPRSLAEGLARVVQALVLVPAAAYLAAPLDRSSVALATLVAGLYLAGSVFAVRSVIRERGNTRFAALSIGYHVAAAIAAAIFLPLPYAILFALLALRSIALPLAQRSRVRSGRPLRPIAIGAVEIVASVFVVALCFATPL